MSEKTVLDVHGLGKAFRTYSHEMGRVLSWFSSRYGSYDERWVLRDISFALPAGASLAVVGENGAGKSTLLKLITGTLKATEGTIAVSGSIAAILELGMGFNPDLTARQNIYQAGGLLGHGRAELAEKMDEIEAFAEIGDYFDQPMRVFSSGMQMRVAFALATAFRPDILIVDEALAVGDAYFQQKCFERIRRFREAGTAFIYVSHDRSAVLSLCDRAILLAEGHVVKSGAPDEIMDYYNAMIGTSDDGEIQTEAREDGRTATRSGSFEITLERIVVRDRDGHPISIAKVGTEAELDIELTVHQPIEKLVFGYAIKNRLGQTIFGTNTHYTDQQLYDLGGGDRVRIVVRFPLNLAPGDYSISTSLTDSEHHGSKNYEWRDLAAAFTIVFAKDELFDGLAYIRPVIDVARVAGADGEEG